MTTPRSQVRVNLTCALLAGQIVFLAGIDAIANYVSNMELIKFPCTTIMRHTYAYNVKMTRNAFGSDSVLEFLAPQSTPMNLDYTDNTRNISRKMGSGNMDGGQFAEYISFPWNIS